MLGSDDHSIECGKAKIGQRASKGTRKVLYRYESYTKHRSRLSKVHKRSPKSNRSFDTCYMTSFTRRFQWWRYFLYLTPGSGQKRSNKVKVWKIVFDFLNTCFDGILSADSNGVINFSRRRQEMSKNVIENSDVTHWYIHWHHMGVKNRDDG